MRKLFMILGWGAVGVAVLAIPLAFAIDAAFGRDVVWMANMRSAEDRAFMETQPDEDFVDVYGVPYRRNEVTREPEAIRTLFVRDADVVIAKRDPSLVMLPVTDLDAGAPLQASSLHHISWLVAAGAGGFGLVVLLALKFTRRKTESANAPA